MYKFQCGLYNEYYYGECVRHLALKCGEHVDISPLTNRRMQPRKNSAVRHHLLNFNYSGTIEYFSVLCHENKKCSLKLKENLIIMRDRPSMNRNIPFSICLNEFLPHFLLQFVEFLDPFFRYFK